MMRLAVVAFLFLASGAQAQQRAIPVPSGLIVSGDRITAEALVDKTFNVPDAAAKSFALERRQIEGLYAKRMLLPGKPVPLSAVKDRDAVVQGALTPATFSVNGLVISTYLVAQQSAPAGETILARNPAFGTLVKARVLKDGSLEVGP
jgi:flagellar basal body P-ring formation protein FlgA